MSDETQEQAAEEMPEDTQAAQEAAPQGQEAAPQGQEEAAGQEAQGPGGPEGQAQEGEAQEGEEARPKRRRGPRRVATNREDSLALVEAALFASPEPLNARELAPYIAEGETVDGLIKELRRKYAGGGVRLEESGRAWAFRTASEYGERLKIVRERKRRISRAAAETLAVIAYNQPVTRGQIEEIRGVALSGGTLDTLVEAG